MSEWHATVKKHGRAQAQPWAFAPDVVLPDSQQQGPQGLPTCPANHCSARVVNSATAACSTHQQTCCWYFEQQHVPHMHRIGTLFLKCISLCPQACDVFVHDVPGKGAEVPLLVIVWPVFASAVSVIPEIWYTATANPSQCVCPCVRLHSMLVATRPAAKLILWHSMTPGPRPKVPHLFQLARLRSACLAASA